ncbi:hypothetical protein HDK90DRAFT_509602 [Phyllosticta capitalensis]|uniref:Uncharacterized protein n=1 Tax=Phyllosticta capitalensis TaxID=121624 RepID=A0ABR1YSF3_9PEZI
MARIKPEPGSNCFIPRPKSRCTLRDSKSPNFNKPSASTKATTTLKNDGIKIENNDKTAPSLPPKKRRGRDNYDENREIILSTPRNISRPVSPVLGSGRDIHYSGASHDHSNTSAGTLPSPSKSTAFSPYIMPAKSQTSKKGYASSSSPPSPAGSRGFSSYGDNDDVDCSSHTYAAFLNRLIIMAYQQQGGLEPTFAGDVSKKKY